MRSKKWCIDQGVKEKQKKRDDVKTDEAKAMVCSAIRSAVRLSLHWDISVLRSSTWLFICTAG